MGNTPEIRLKVYELIVSRYKEHIDQNEHKSIAELRERISPYNDHIRSLRDRLIADLGQYEYEKHFPSALERCLEYIKSIETVHLPVSFWMDFPIMESIKAGDEIDKALLLTSLLRSLACPNAKSIITKSRKVYVGYEWKGESRLLDPDSGSQHIGPDASAVFIADPIEYAFSDLYFESYGDE